MLCSCSAMTIGMEVRLPEELTGLVWDQHASEGDRIFIGSEVLCTRVRVTGQREVGAGHWEGFLMDSGGTVELR